ncbi:AAA domain-containing protein [Parasitella parasitica]|nr:AAA domain-containing protein [Parasitella parasitica]
MQKGKFLACFPSSYQLALSKCCLQDWQRVNQDDMKTRKACEMRTREYLDKRQSVVVDRCNFDRSQRQTWIDIAQHYKVPIDCIVLTATKEDCGNRIRERENHPTDVQGERGVGILSRFVKGYRPPRLDSKEGFSRILYLDPSPETTCTKERIEKIFELLEECPLLLPSESTRTYFEKPNVTTDSEGWSTIPVTRKEE